MYEICSLKFVYKIFGWFSSNVWISLCLWHLMNLFFQPSSFYEESLNFIIDVDVPCIVFGYLLLAGLDCSFSFLPFCYTLFLMLRTIPKFWGRYLYPSKSGLGANYECPLWCFRSNFDFQHLQHFLILELCAKDLYLSILIKKILLFLFFNSLL